MTLAECTRPDTIFQELKYDPWKTEHLCRDDEDRCYGETSHQSIDEMIQTNPQLVKRLLYDLADRLEKQPKMANLETSLVWCLERPLYGDGCSGRL